MSEVPYFSDHGEPTMSGELGIERNRRLLTPAVSEQYGMHEFPEVASGRRLLSIPRQSEQTKIHEALSEKDIPIFPVVNVDERNIFLSVPPDARSLHASLRFIARDVTHYGETFHQLGELLGRCQAAGLGLPDKNVRTTLLEGLAYSSSESDPFGGTMRLAPPYELSKDRTKAEELHIIHDELTDSRYFSAWQTHHLMDMLEDGWDHVRS